jgi:hypothetical protein
MFPGHYGGQQRERQREDRMAEADQFKVVADGFVHVCNSHAKAPRREGRKELTAEGTAVTEKKQADLSLVICHLKLTISEMTNDKLQICNDQFSCLP